MQPDFLNLSLFQLRNLLTQQVPFLFLDLTTSEVMDSEVTSLLQRATKVEADKAIEFVEAKAADPSFPVVLVANRAEQGAFVAQALASKNFINLYLLALDELA
ncbi:MAG: hypothetical protein CL675_08700 [Bdellovibrionaceae bacterium]|nr:hypothetical protein [Pseudobdellovibrionaceae bacterium]|tara:strand:+ start:243 stop:551 length:309 start_codon:yes stop_codon:yes gene_type:complete